MLPLLHPVLLTMAAVRAKDNPFRVVTNIPGRMPSNVYSAEVRASTSSAWVTSFVLQTIARNASHAKDMSGGMGGCGYFQHLNGWSASWLNVEVDRGTSVQVRVKRINGKPIVAARPHPASAGIKVLSISEEGVVLHVPGTSRFMVDFDAGLDYTDTGPNYKGPPIHTFGIFVNPMLAIPNPVSDPTVTVVKAGEPIPGNLSPGSTLVFGPGVHHGPRDSNGFRIWDVPSDVRVFVRADAILHAALKNTGGWGKDNITLIGYGTISGEDQDRCGSQHDTKCCSKNVSPQGLTLAGTHRSVITGVTFVDFPNHHIIALATACDTPSIFSNVKVWGWRANGDGLHVFGTWVVKDLFMRTQDDSMYTVTHRFISKSQLGL